MKDYRSEPPALDGSADTDLTIDLVYSARVARARADGEEGTQC
jgi:hypothetical protein